MGRRKKFEPIRLYTNKPEDIFKNYQREISKAIINAIDYGIKSKIKKVDFAQLIMKEVLVITLSIDSREFKDLIEENLQTLIDFEEYEVCALAVKLKDKL
jgi:hypothetical protein